MPKTPSEAARQLLRASLHGPTMATRWSVLCDVDRELDQAALHAALADAVDQVDQQMSLWKPDSDLVRLNRAGIDEWVALPPEIMEVLSRALEIARLSDGAFDPAVGALVEAWGFGAGSDTPDAAAIRAARQSDRGPAHRSLELDPAAARARKHAPMQLDLCGIAKGYGVDRLIAVLKGHGVAHALAALDGELRALGAQADSQPWAVAVESPEPGRRAAHGVIELADVAVATSGDYRRWVQIGAARLSHTMDERRAAPVNNDVASVTVLASDCMSADAWATALLVAGPEQGLALAQRMGLEALFLLRREQRWVELGIGRFAQPGTPARVADAVR
ncbi:FAD:protein FMN transferase [Ottowia sp.]|uniref:FAD:protein FMN transferase n=1 Tax=Ottowia sp. TaxID=1898956 RepID=UPI002C97B813|nr:FAD:protein FMN transferase [Ottowia sp.]HRN74692.1 FAD:protein FMN transferase [Ottowia sp.]HRQ01522.1 FAD:protein FMN transferase [Ottowia sp.]